MNRLSPKNSVILLLILRFLYSMNWYNVSPYLISVTQFYSEAEANSGLILSAFLLGAGIFQIPSGILAARIGTRKVALWGMIIMSISVILSPLSPDFLVFLASRFFVGVASAFFFSSGIVLLNQIDRGNTDGKITLFNVSFAAGGGFGVIFFGEITRYLSWQPALFISGIITLVPSAIALIMIPEPGIVRKNMKGIMRKVYKPSILLISIGIGGYWAMNFTIPEFLNNFTLVVTGSVNTAGIVASLALFSGIFGIFFLPIARKLKPLTSMAGLIALLSALVLLMPISNGIGLGVIAFVEGVFSITIFSGEYYYVVLLEKDESVVPISIATMNSIQICMGSIVTFLFSIIYAENRSYAWWILGIIPLILFPIAISSLRNLSKASGGQTS